MEGEISGSGKPWGVCRGSDCAHLDSGGHRGAVFSGRGAPAGNPDVLFYDKGMAILPAVGQKPVGAGPGPDGFCGNRGNGWGGVSCECP